MPSYQYRFANSAGLIQMTWTRSVEDDAEAKVSGQTIFDTFLDFKSLQIWLLDRRVATVRLRSLPGTVLAADRPT
jgi:hypothetical protein